MKQTSFQLKEVKTIKNSRIIYAHVFVTALLLALLTSLLTGIVVAPKPDKPGKPPFEPPPIQYYMFSIDMEGQELDLVSPDNLEVVSYADDSGWYLAPAKKIKAVDWHAYLNEFWPRLEEEECGKYTTDLVNVPASIDAQNFDINCYWTLTPHKGLGYDGQPANFWEIDITWGWHEDDWDPSDVHHLRVWTDYGAEAEGTYHPDDDMWIIYFSGASWELWASDAEGYGHLTDWGTISELTVTITNNGPVSS